MKKTLLSLMMFTQLSFSASTEQVAQYVMISHADRDLIEMEQMMEEMIPSNSEKNTEMISIRFNEYLEKNLSDNEITELIKLYKEPLLQTLRELDSDVPETELNEFNLTLEENPLSSERLDLNLDIIKNMFDDENLKILLYGLQEKISELAGQSSKENLFTKEEEEEFFNAMREELKLPMLYTTQTLGMEELKELYELTDKAIIRKSNKIELEASLYAMENFLQDMMNSIKKTNMQEMTNNSPSEK